MDKIIFPRMLLAFLLCMSLPADSKSEQHATFVFPGITQNWQGDYLAIVQGTEIGEDSSIQKRGQYEHTVSIDDVSFVESDDNAGQILISFQTSAIQGKEIQDNNEKTFSVAGLSGKVVLNVSDRSFEILWDDQVDDPEAFLSVRTVIRRFFNSFLGCPPSVVRQEFVIGHIWQVRKSNETLRIAETRGDGSFVCSLYISASIDLDDDLDPIGEVVFSNLGFIESIQSKSVHPRIERVVRVNRVKNNVATSP